jgi:hypothetical protein
MAELDDFMKNITKLIKAMENMDKGMVKLAKTATKSSSSLDGGAKNMGTSSGNILANSFGMGTPAAPNDPNRRSVRTAAKFGREGDTDYYSTGGSIGREFKKRGMADVRFRASNGDPLTQGDMDYNQSLAEAQRDKVWNKKMGVGGPMGAVGKALGYQGITRQQFQLLPESAQNNIASAMPTPQDSLNLMSGIQNATSTFLPDVGKAMTRATGYYNATRAGGNQANRGAVTRNTFDRMNDIGGISSVGSDANVAEYLAGRGMTQSGDTNSTYQQTIRATAHASKYMNISNEQAVQSIEGLTSGQGSGNMLRQLGIYTADLKTGKEKTQGQIFEEVAQRLTAGRRGASVEQTQASIRRGTLGSTISGLFQDETTQNMFKQYMVDRAGGKSMDLSYTGAMDKLYAGQSDSNRNPLNAQMTLNANETEALGMAQDEYIKGMETAATVLGVLQKAAGTAAATMMGFPNALMQTLMGSNTVRGLTQGAQSIASYASKGIAGVQEAVLQGEYDTPQGATVSAVQVAAIGMASLIGAGPALASSGGQLMLGVGSKGFSSGSAGDPPGGGGDATGASSVTTSMFSGLGGGASIDTAGMATDGLIQSSDNYTFNSYSKESGKKHSADDFSMPIGTPVRAIADGIVQKVDKTVNYNTRNKSGNRGAMSATQKNSLGMFVRIYHPGGYVSVYGHLSQINVEEKQAVKKGDIIGLSGNTGNSTGPHLHLKITKSTGVNNYNDAAAVDPKSVSVAQLVGTGRTAGTTDNTGTDSSSMSSIMTAAQKPSSDAQRSINLLTQLYSGDSDDIRTAISSMSAGMGVSLSPTATYANTYGISKNPSAGSATAAALVGKATGTGNTVNITVQVPDTSPTEAEKFARLVKQFLEDNTLQTNTMKA